MHNKTDRSNPDQVFVTLRGGANLWDRAIQTLNESAIDQLAKAELVPADDESRQLLEQHGVMDRVREHQEELSWEKTRASRRGRV